MPLSPFLSFSLPSSLPPSLPLRPLASRPSPSHYASIIALFPKVTISYWYHQYTCGNWSGTDWPLSWHHQCRLRPRLRMHCSGLPRPGLLTSWVHRLDLREARSELAPVTMANKPRIEAGTCFETFTTKNGQNGFRTPMKHRTRWTLLVASE